VRRSLVIEQSTLGEDFHLARGNGLTQRSDRDHRDQFFSRQETRVNQRVRLARVVIWDFNQGAFVACAVVSHWMEQN